MNDFWIGVGVTVACFIIHRIIWRKPTRESYNEYTVYRYPISNCATKRRR